MCMSKIQSNHSILVTPGKRNRQSEEDDEEQLRQKLLASMHSHSQVSFIFPKNSHEFHNKSCLSQKKRKSYPRVSHPKSKVHAHTLLFVFIAHIGKGLPNATAKRGKPFGVRG